MARLNVVEAVNQDRHETSERLFKTVASRRLVLLCESNGEVFSTGSDEGKWEGDRC